MGFKYVRQKLAGYRLITFWMSRFSLTQSYSVAWRSKERLDVSLTRLRVCFSMAAQHQYRV